MLNHPVETVINRGGFIFLAKSGETIIGSAGLMKEYEDVYELAKMAVAPDFLEWGSANC